MPKRGFTLLELIVTLALVGLLVGIAGVGLRRFGDSTRRGAALRGVVEALAVARIDSMRTRSAHTLLMSVSDEGVQARTTGAREMRRWWPARGLRMVDERILESSGASAAFDSAGRTRERLWRVLEDGPRPGPTPALDPGVRIWRIEFDPLSGAPSLRAPGEEEDGNRRSK